MTLRREGENEEVGDPQRRRQMTVWCLPGREVSEEVSRIMRPSCGGVDDKLFKDAGLEVLIQQDTSTP